MDRNSIIGLLLIMGLLIGYMFYMQPSKEEIAKQKKLRDSIELVNKQKEAEQTAAAAASASKTQTSTVSNDSNTTTAISVSPAVSDSLKAIQKKNLYGLFAESTTGEKKELTIENEFIKAHVSTLGGRITSVQLKNYKTHNGEPLILFNADSSSFGLVLSAYSKFFATDSMYFTPVGSSVAVQGTDSSTLALRLNTGDKNKYIEFLYSIKGNSYVVGMKINVVGLNDVIASNSSDLTIRWGMRTPTLENNVENERTTSTIYYKYMDEDADNINPSKSEKLALETKVKWIAFKQQFFTSVLIADNGFEKPSDIQTQTIEGSNDYIKDFYAQLTIPYNHQGAETFSSRFYFGPNHYETLKEQGFQLEKQVPLGWGIFGWVNRYLVIPIFNFLNNFNLNYGIIILILTIIFKILLLPIAYKANLSAAKMRVIKPEIEELNKKFEKEEPMKKQQAVMSLYKKAGISPMAGCIPALLQMPILFALINFFPTSIELRQQSFLWATDLSTFDTVMQLPFHIPGYGSHVSLFALLMTVSTYLYMYSNNQLMGGGSDPMQQQMKWVMYIMPVFFLGFLNSRSAALSYYYFLANMITFGQTFVLRRFIDEGKIHAQIQENKKKPAKASNWQKRMENLMRERQRQAEEARKKKK